MNVPQKCSIGVRWLATAHTCLFLLIYLSILSVQMFWSSIPRLFQRFSRASELKTVTVGYETVTWYAFFAPQT